MASEPSQVIAGRWAIAVRAWLIRRKRSQAWLADEAGVSSGYLGTCLRGRWWPEDKLLEKLERAMKLAPTALVNIRLTDSLAECLTAIVDYVQSDPGQTLVPDGCVSDARRLLAMIGEPIIDAPEQEETR